MPQIASVTRFAQLIVPVGLTTAYTVASTGGGILKDIVLVNTGATTETVTLYVVPTAGSATVANTVLPGVEVRPGELKVITLSYVLEDDDTIQVITSDAANAIGLTLSGVLVV